MAKDVRVETEDGSGMKIVAVTVTQTSERTEQWGLESISARRAVIRATLASRRADIDALATEDEELAGYEALLKD